MKKNRIEVLCTILIIAFAAICICCEKDDTRNNLNGIILYMPPPDNCNDYVIKSEDNSLLKPSNLSDEYRIDSLLIRFAFDSTDNFHNCGFGGSIPVIDLTHIEKR